MIETISQPISSQKIGQQAERLAAEYLLQKGLVLREKNFHSRFGEIDLIFEIKKTIVFVEVRYRKTSNTVSAIESIDVRKCARIIKTAQSYMQTLKKQDTYDYRIDVITVSGNLSDPDFDWIISAIEN